MKEWVKGLILVILGLVVLALAIFGTKDIASAVVGGLIVFCGIAWIVLDLTKKNKRK